MLIRSYVVDGVPRPPRTLADVHILPGVVEACATLRRHGLPLIVVTNQPDVARGTLRRDEVDAVNDLLREALPLTEVVVCPHDDPDRCGCRKPAPGMIVDAAARHRISLSDSVMVGDRWRDIAAGRAAGCRTIFIDQGYAESVSEKPDLVAGSLSEAVPAILAMTGREGAEGEAGT